MYEKFGFTRAASGEQTITLFIPDNVGGAPAQAIVLNFSNAVRYVDVPLPQSGAWIDLLNNNTSVNVANYWLDSFAVQSNWGSILHQGASES